MTNRMNSSTAARPAGGSAQCPHSDLHFNLNNAAFGNTNLHYLEITAKCTICGTSMVFCGPTGMGPDQPACSLDGKEIRLPFLAEGEELVGKPIGYSVRAHD
jgi:hypothetical protein